MFRARMAAVGLMVGLGLTSGCTSCSSRPWFSRVRGVPTEDCCEADDTCMMNGPMLEGYPSMVPPSTGTFPGMPTPVIPQTGLPPGSGAPARLVPEPQAQPVPAAPSKRTPGTFTEFWRQ
jgi:hypothetical protein